MQNNPHEALFLVGLLIGGAFGYVSARTNFCVMGAISDFRTFASPGRLGAVALAAAIAIAGAQTLDAYRLVDLSLSMFLAPSISVLGAVAGGLVFGAGMVYTGGCASRNLVRAGSGDLRALLSLFVLAAAAFATISGVFSPLRSSFEMTTALDVSGNRELSRLSGPFVLTLGLGATTARAMVAALMIVPLLAFAFVKAQLARDPINLLAGLGAGALVTAGWFVTGMTYDEMALRPIPPMSLSFVRPVADALDWVERSSALGLPGFGAATVFGALLGSFVASLLAGGFKTTGFADRGDVLRHIGGAMAMGIGGVFALGCSIGQGLTGLSTLSVQSLVAATSIFAGAWLALGRLERNI
ncbi:MAG: YeeE/YedE family protein [Hyphomicrobiaceae bacterium]